MTYSPDVIGAKRYLQIFKDLGGLLDPFLQLKKEGWFECQRCMWKDEHVVFEGTVLSDTDPPWYSSLILVEALDFSQIIRWRALHLETVLQDKIYRDTFTRLRQSLKENVCVSFLTSPATQDTETTLGRLSGESVCSLTSSQTNSHFFSLSYWLSSFSLSGGRFMRLWKTQKKNKCEQIIHVQNVTLNDMYCRSPLLSAFKNTKEKGNFLLMHKVFKTFWK